MNKLFTRAFVMVWDLFLFLYLIAGLIGAYSMYTNGFNLVFTYGYLGGVVLLGMLSLFISMYDKVCEIDKKGDL